MAKPINLNVSSPLGSRAASVDPEFGEPLRGARASAVVAVLAYTGIVAAGTQTIIIPLLALLPGILDASPDDTAWAVTASLLASAVSVPVVGRLGDMHGKRRIMTVCLIPLILGSILCALAGALPAMIAGRALQGLGMGVVPLGISLLREVLPRDRVGSSVATMSASMGIGGALALPFAAAVAENASWRGMFWAFAALGCLALVLMLRFVPAGRPGRPGETFDVLGTALLTCTLVCLLLAVSKGAAWGWASGPVIGLFISGGLLLTAWSVQQLRSRHPLVNLRTLAFGPAALINLASLLIGSSMYVHMLVLPQILQLPEHTGYGLGQSMLQMSLWLMPGGVTMMLVSPLGARITAARGAKTTLVFGALFIALGYVAALLLIGQTWGPMVAIIVANSGVGLAYGAIPMLVMAVVPAEESASANGFNTLTRSVGTSAASAVVGVVLAAFSVTSGGHTVPTLEGFQIALAVGGTAALLSALMLMFTPPIPPLAGTGI